MNPDIYFLEMYSEVFGWMPVTGITATSVCASLEWPPKWRFDSSAEAFQYRRYAEEICSSAFRVSVIVNPAEVPA